MYEIGDIGICKHCDGEIVFVDPYWDHPGKLKPRHIAEPRKIKSSGKLEVLRLEINKLELKPTDMLVVKFPGNVTESDIWQFQKDFNEIIPEGVKGIILKGDIQLYIISKEEETDGK